MAGGRILVVDDDSALRASISRILEEEGYTVDSAADGATALEIVGKEPPDAILLDVMMPGMNGRQFLQELRRIEEGPKIPVVMMTALQGLTTRASEYGADDLVEKPFDVDELLNKVALALFRSSEYDTITDRPAIPRRPHEAPPRPEPAPQPAGLILVVDEDKDSLAQIDRDLGSQGYTVVSLARPTDELIRLARVLEPKAIALALHGEAPAAMDALRAIRGTPELDTLPILVFADSEVAIAPHRREIARLRAKAVSPASQLAHYLA